MKAGMKNAMKVGVRKGEWDFPIRVILSLLNLYI